MLQNQPQELGTGQCSGLHLFRLTVLVAEGDQTILTRNNILFLERIRLDCVSEASHNLNRLLDKPGGSRKADFIIRKYLFGFCWLR